MLNVKVFETNCDIFSRFCVYKVELLARLRVSESMQKQMNNLDKNKIDTEVFLKMCLNLFRKNEISICSKSEIFITKRMSLDFHNIWSGFLFTDVHTDFMNNNLNIRTNKFVHRLLVVDLKKIYPNNVDVSWTF